MLPCSSYKIVSFTLNFVKIYLLLADKKLVIQIIKCAPPIPIRLSITDRRLFLANISKYEGKYLRDKLVLCYEPYAKPVLCFHRVIMTKTSLTDAKYT